MPPWPLRKNVETTLFLVLAYAAGLKRLARLIGIIALMSHVKLARGFAPYIPGSAT